MQGELNELIEIEEPKGRYIKAVCLEMYCARGYSRKEMADCIGALSG